MKTFLSVSCAPQASELSDVARKATQISGTDNTLSDLVDANGWMMSSFANRNQHQECRNGLCSSNWHPASSERNEPVLLDVRPDTVDFRDRIYAPTLVEVPPEIPLTRYLEHRIPILNQGRDGACTGFALATVAHYLLRTRKISPDQTLVSPRMFYEIAKRYDNFPGEDYEGSTARAAIKGWYKHGVCPEAEWPASSNPPDRRLTIERAQAALKYPLGAYYRVECKDIVAMHTALAEVGVLYATAAVHDGWRSVQDDGEVHLSDQVIGGHAFVIVGFDADGFWFQNSWGESWGRGGFGHITYKDWLINGHDVWVMRLGAEIHSVDVIAHDETPPLAGAGAGSTFCQMRPHVIAVGNDGAPASSGMFANDAQDIREIFEKHFPRITQNWKKKRVVFYAHGGLVSEAAATAKLNAWRQTLLDNEIYPIFFVWHTDLFSTTRSILEDALSFKHFGSYQSAGAVLRSLADEMIEPFARVIGRPIWEEMKENAFQSTIQTWGAACIAARHAVRLTLSSNVEFHFAAHSAGSIFLALFMQLLCSAGIIQSGPIKGRIGFGIVAETLTMWAPACTIDLFREIYQPLLEVQRIKKFALFTLDDLSEQSDNCSKLYGKSLLYLVANAFEEKPRISWQSAPGTPLLGMQKFIRADKELRDLFSKSSGRNIDWIVCPNRTACGDAFASQARCHGVFDHDKCTLLATVARILNVPFVDPSAVIRPPHSEPGATQSAKIPEKC